MTEPPSPTVGSAPVSVVGADARTPADERAGEGEIELAVDVDVDRWCRLAAAVLTDEQRRGEATLTFVDADEIAALNREHLGGDGPTDVLSFPIDADLPESRADREPAAGAAPPTVLLGDIVICPEVAAAQASTHAGSLDDELALLVVHGALHLVGHDHAADADTALMRARELELLHTHHWDGPAPAGFRQEPSE